MSEYEHVCPGCFKDKGKGLVCPHCKYKELTKRPLFLPYRSKLKKRFVIGKNLGEPDVLGISYLAFDLKVKTFVIVKEYLPPELACRTKNSLKVRPRSSEDAEDFADGLKQFLKEAQTLAGFKHANIVRVRNVFEENSTAYSVLDYYAGLSLSEYLKKQGGKISERLAVDLTMPILDGLQEVHKKKFLHSDINPKNIFLTNDNKPMITNFGNARMAVFQGRGDLSSVLTPGFTPFEQYRKGGKLGPWTDIYSYGATLYYMVTGIVPTEATEREKGDGLMAPEVIAPETSPEFGEAVMKALSVKPKDRPQSVREFQKILKGERTTSLTSPSPRKQGSKWVKILGAAVLVLLIWSLFLRESAKVPSPEKEQLRQEELAKLEREKSALEARLKEEKEALEAKLKEENRSKALLEAERRRAEEEKTMLKAETERAETERKRTVSE